MMVYRKGYFTKKRTKLFLNKNNGCLMLLLIITSFSLVISCSESSDDKNVTNCPTKTCGDFLTQAQAQKTYNSDKKCYKNLDADNDGIACENLPK